MEHPWRYARGVNESFRPRLLAVLALCTMSTACPADLMQDFTETYLLTDPVELFEIVVDRGSLVAITYDLSAVKLKRHTFGLASSLVKPEYSIEDGVVRFESHCTGRKDECTWDHMLELPYGVGFDLTMTEALIDLTNTDGDITANFGLGDFKGSGLKSSHVDITAETATVVMEFATAPEAVTINLQAGNVTLTVPAGTYQCNFASAAGEVVMSGINCDATAASILDVQVAAGDITVSAATP